MVMERPKPAASCSDDGGEGSHLNSVLISTPWNFHSSFLWTICFPWLSLIPKDRHGLPTGWRNYRCILNILSCGRAFLCSFDLPGQKSWDKFFFGAGCPRWCLIGLSEVLRLCIGSVLYSSGCSLHGRAPYNFFFKIRNKCDATEKIICILERGANPQRAHWKNKKLQVNGKL